MTGFELGTDRPSVIVAGVDGSPTSLRAAAYAAGLARRQGSPLVAVFVKAHVGGLVAFADRSGDGVTATLDAQVEIEDELRDLVAGYASRWGADVELVVRTGDPFHELTAVAAERAADAVVVGASGSVGHRIAGSLAVRLVRCGRWPVTVVP